MNDLISVVIPAYNASSRIKATLESVIAQDYPNIEIIVVNDSSTDNTGELASSVLESSGRKFKLINHTTNKGECASRNTGIENATGEYISFIDADDLIEPSFISSLYAAILKDDCEISYCGLVDRFTNGRPDDLKNHSDELRVKPPITGETVILDDAMPAVVCCLYSTNFIGKYNLKFYEGCTTGGDINFVMKAMCQAKKVTFIEQCLYIYIHHSEMGSVRDNNTPNKKFLRYEHNTQAQLDTAEYILQHASSKALKKYAENILKPQSIIRKFKLYAMKNDKAGYDLLLRKNDISNAFSFYTLSHKPEIFLKALAIKIIPWLYFRLRRR